MKTSSEYYDNIIRIKDNKDLQSQLKAILENHNPEIFNVGSLERLLITAHSRSFDRGVSGPHDKRIERQYKINAAKSIKALLETEDYDYLFSDPIALKLIEYAIQVGLCPIDSYNTPLNSLDLVEDMYKYSLDTVNKKLQIEIYDMFDKVQYKNNEASVIFKEGNREIFLKWLECIKIEWDDNLSYLFESDMSMTGQELTFAKEVYTLENNLLTLRFESANHALLLNRKLHFCVLPANGILPIKLNSIEDSADLIFVSGTPLYYPGSRDSVSDNKTALDNHNSMNSIPKIKTAPGRSNLADLVPDNKAIPDHLLKEIYINKNREIVLTFNDGCKKALLNYLKTLENSVNKNLILIFREPKDIDLASNSLVIKQSSGREDIGSYEAFGGEFSINFRFKAGKDLKGDKELFMEKLGVTFDHVDKDASNWGTALYFKTSSLWPGSPSLPESSIIFPNLTANKPVEIISNVEKISEVAPDLQPEKVPEYQENHSDESNLDLTLTGVTPDSSDS